MRPLPIVALAAALALGGCQNPDGSTDWGSSLALGAGAAALVGLVAIAANNNDDDRQYRQARRHGGHGDSGYRRYAGRQGQHRRTGW